MNVSKTLRSTAVAILCAACIASGARSSAAQDASSGEIAANGQAFVKLLTENLFSKDPKIRYSLSKALETMGNQAIPHLNRLKSSSKNQHHRAFLTRIIKRIRPDKKVSAEETDRRRFSSMMGWASGLDIDRIAMEVGLDFEQMAKVEPIMARTQKNVTDLWEEFRKADAWRDREAWSVLREEQSATVDEAMAELRKHVGGKQALKLKKVVDRFVNPMGNWGRGGRGGGRGDRRGRGGRGGGRERP